MSPMPPTDGPAPDHSDDPIDDEGRELVELHVALDLEGEAARLAEAAEPWEPPDA